MTTVPSAIEAFTLSNKNKISNWQNTQKGIDNHCRINIIKAIQEGLFHADCSDMISDSLINELTEQKNFRKTLEVNDNPDIIIMPSYRFRWDLSK